MPEPDPPRLHVPLLPLSDSSLFSDEEEEIDEAQGVPIPGLHDPSACALPPHHPPPHPPPPHHGSGIHGGILPPSHMSPLPPPPHMEHPPPPGGAGPFFHGPGIPPAPPPGAGGPKLGETNNNSMEKDLHGVGGGVGMGKGDEEESVDGDADNCKGEDSENKSPDDGAGGKRRGPRTTIKARTDKSVRSSDGVKSRRDRTSKDVNDNTFLNNPLHFLATFFHVQLKCNPAWCAAALYRGETFLL